MKPITNYNQLNQQILNLNKIDISNTFINPQIFHSLNNVNRYDEFKQGFKTDVSKFFSSIYDAVGFFFLLLTLGMLYFLVFSHYFHHTPEFKIMCGIPLVLITLGLFFVKSFSNALITIWLFVFKLAVNLLIIGVFGGIIYVIIHHLFIG